MSSLTPQVEALFGTTASPINTPVEMKLFFQPASGQWKKAPCTVQRENGRLLFVKSDRLLKSTVKAMADSKWHPAPDLYWSIADSPRNRFQLEFLLGGNPYAWFERPIVKHDYQPRYNHDHKAWLSLFEHQKEDADRGLTHHFLIDAAEMGVAKTLPRIEQMERSGITNWWWVTRASLVQNAYREFEIWSMQPHVNVDVMSYDNFVSRVGESPEIVQGIVFDEARALTNPVAKRSIAAQQYTDWMRTTYGHACHIVPMSGSPAPKNPGEWHSLCEITYPGYLKEGSRKALEQRLGVYADQEFSAGTFRQRVGWKDGTERCVTCGLTLGEHDGTQVHEFKPVKNEIAYLNERLSGIVFKRFKRDVLKDLPEYTYRVVYVKPAPGVLRAAKLIAETAETAISAYSKLLELSDGFQYVEVIDGESKCPECVEGQSTDATTGTTGVCKRCTGTALIPRKVRKTEMIVCPKDQVLVDLLAENDEVGRLIVYGGFDGTLDRIQKVCQQNGWAVVRCDGHGIHAYDANGQSLTGFDPMEVWRDKDRWPHTVWDANAESGGIGHTLVEAYMAFFYSNSSKPEARSQAKARHHRPGMDANKGGVIVDVIHLPSDEKVLATLNDNRRIELMTLGEITDSYTLAV